MALTYDRSTNNPLNVPGTYAVAVTPNDSTDLTYTARALYVGGVGDISLITQDGQTVTFSAIPAGSILPLMVNRVLATGTTATLIIAIS